MPILTATEDAFGAALRDHLLGRDGPQLTLERDDGWTAPATPPSEFFKGPQDWPAWEIFLLNSIEGPVLDLGCGAGRHSLHLQEQGLAVTAVDHSPGAVAVCKARGLGDIRLGDLIEPPADKRWRTILLMSGNLGLAGGWEETRGLLTRLAEISASGSALIADTVDPTATDDPVHLAYMEAMQARGLHVGLVRLRLRHGDRLTPWWNLLNVPGSDVGALVTGTGWDLERHLDIGPDQAILLRRITG